MTHPFALIERRFGKGVIAYLTEKDGSKTALLPPSLIGEFGLFIDDVTRAYVQVEMPLEKLGKHVNLEHPDWLKARASKLGR